MDNPWKEISFDNYLKHMSHENVNQYQTINKIIKEQCELVKDFSEIQTAVLGITDRNGIEHINKLACKKIIGIDINQSYLDECNKKYPEINNLELHCLDLIKDKTIAIETLNDVDFLICNLIVEHIHLDNFIYIIKNLKKKDRIVSCVIQFNEDTNVISDSGYQKAFECLIPIINEASEENITREMLNIGYNLKYRKIYNLPNNKYLIRMDYILKP